MMKQEKREDAQDSQPTDQNPPQSQEQPQTSQEQETAEGLNDQKNKNNKTHGKHDRHHEEIKKLLSETETKLAESQDKYLRLAAEFDNYRKRTLKERMDLIKAAGEDTLLRVIPVLDDFERGLKLIDISREVEPMKEGIHLIYNKFKEILNQLGVKEIDAINKEFSTDLHEAITKIPAPDENSKGKVLDVVEKGYFLNDKVIRYAKVIVGE